MATQTVPNLQTANRHQPSFEWQMLPTHLDLPESDGSFVKNFQEHPESMLLSDTIWPKLDEIHPDGRYAVGQDSGIYWRLTEPRHRGAEAPDWFYVPNVAPMLDDTYRRSYVLWQEHIPPMIVIEFVSGKGDEERDKTPLKGKFWVYEQAIHAPYYAIYEPKKAHLEVHQLIAGHYQEMAPNAAGRFPIASMGVELGIWHGEYRNVTLPWLRWWDMDGNLLPTGDERAEVQRLRAEEESRRAEEESRRAEEESRRADAAITRAMEERARADLLAEKLRALGIDPDALG